METRYLFGLPLVTARIGSRSVELVLDTGFDGALSLPRRAVEELRLPRVGRVSCDLADGTMAKMDVFEAGIDWLGTVRCVEVVVSDAGPPLLGMGLLQCARVFMEPARNILAVAPA
jgi:clan AA aspartic protease